MTVVPTTSDALLYQDSARFVDWLQRRVIHAARGDAQDVMEVAPHGRFWLGRLAPESTVAERELGDRGERLDPCAVGIRCRPSTSPPWSFTVQVRLRVWRGGDGSWSKSPPVVVSVPCDVPDATDASVTFGEVALSTALARLDDGIGHRCAIRVDVESAIDGRSDLTVVLVNTAESTETRGHFAPDLNLYEVSLCIDGLRIVPYQLASLPDTFRYDRDVPAFGINCGVEREGERLRTVDVPSVSRARPVYWALETPPPDLSFATLVNDPFPSLERLVSDLRHWGETHWGPAALADREAREGWTSEMRAQANAEARTFVGELDRVVHGLDLLRSTSDLTRAFRLMNAAVAHSSRGRYAGWRPFQVGFLLANLPSLVDATEETRTADIVWFATGGGKTETYLGLLTMAALHDRIRGKRAGITAWSRFPLRMLSLQQTQRFADAMAGAELVRRREGIPGEPFSTGFFVGDTATPNTIRDEPRDGQPDPDDDEMPARYQVLRSCPFCFGRDLSMSFSRLRWTLEHRCNNPDCPWKDQGPLPFYVVDEEIYRFLPTVVVGTLDKAALIAWQAGMRGFVGPPKGRCTREGHGYIYAQRSSRPNGCRVPGCNGRPGPLDMDAELFAPTFRLQDELHLLRDSLGAVDSHYEAILDSLQRETSGRQPKILASSATLTGYDKQVEVLYQRRGRVFPVPGPAPGVGFWTADGPDLARRFLALAPRGVTVEYAVDRLLTELQTAVRLLLTDPETVCREAGVSPTSVDHLISIYGTDVLYGNTIRDLDAVHRSVQTQVLVEGGLHMASLTGQTDFEEVRTVLERLDAPEPDFFDRIHLVTASSMMSHGVDVDRLNVMVVLGVPLTTAEFIQATARVGRRWPALVLVVHKMARERDAGIFRAFDPFVRQGDRFVEPIPITRRSRRVLARTIAGLELSRIYGLHEPRSRQGLTTASRLSEYFTDAHITEEDERRAIVELLGLDTDTDRAACKDVEEWVEEFFRNLASPPNTQSRLLGDLCPWGKPMASLRDVDSQIPVGD